MTINPTPPISRRAMLGLFGLAVAACSSKTPPAILTLSIKGAADQNPDTNGHAAPVAVRLYQLASPAKFTRADFFALTEREATTLGADEMASEDILLAPGETQTLTRELKPGVQAIAVAVLFRDIDHATWRATAPVAASGPSKLTLTLTGLTAKLAPT